MINNPQLFEALGGSFLYNEYRGNFVQAAAIADQALQAETTTETLMDRGIVHLLQGEIARVDSLFDRARSLSTSDSSQLFRALAYGFLSRLMAFAWYHGGFDPSCTDVVVHGSYTL
jgi:hypothetical protein